MIDAVLVYRTEIDVQGEMYGIRVYSRHNGTHFASTDFTNGDVIISDGRTVEEVLAKHARLIPLAVQSRKILHEVDGEGPILP